MPTHLSIFLLLVKLCWSSHTDWDKQTQAGIKRAEPKTCVRMLVTHLGSYCFPLWRQRGQISKFCRCSFQRLFFQSHTFLKGKQSKELNKKCFHYCKFKGCQHAFVISVFHHMRPFRTRHGHLCHISHPSDTLPLVHHGVLPKYFTPDLSLTVLLLFSFSLCVSLCFSHQPDLRLLALFAMLFSEGEELLGTEGARYMKMDDMKDHDDDFLSPKKSLAYERGLGTA